MKKLILYILLLLVFSGVLLPADAADIVSEGNIKAEFLLTFLGLGIILNSINSIYDMGIFFYKRLNGAETDPNYLISFLNTTLFFIAYIIADLLVPEEILYEQFKGQENIGVIASIFIILTASFLGLKFLKKEYLNTLKSKVINNISFLIPFVFFFISFNLDSSQSCTNDNCEFITDLVFWQNSTVQILLRIVGLIFIIAIPLAIKFLKPKKILFLQHFSFWFGISLLFISFPFYEI